MVCFAEQSQFNFAILRVILGVCRFLKTTSFVDFNGSRVVCVLMICFVYQSFTTIDFLKREVSVTGVERASWYQLMLTVRTISARIENC